VTEKKQQGRDENQFSSPEIMQKKKRLATVLAISNTSEKNIQKREKEQERRGSKTEGEGNKIGGRRQRPEILHRVSASLRTVTSAFIFFPSLPHFVRSIALREGKLITFAQCMHAWRHLTRASCLFWPSQVTGLGQ
jgi:hypothetical protein